MRHALLAAEHRHDLVTAEGEDEQERAGRQLRAGHRRRIRERAPVDVEDADRGEDDQRQQLGDREDVHDHLALPDAADVDPADRRDDRREERRTRHRSEQRRPVASERVDEDVDHRRPARRAREPHHPADFEGGESAERRACVEVRASGSLEAAPCFGERQRREQRGESDRCDEPRSPCPGRRGEPRGEREDAAADHLVHADGGEVPAAQLAAQLRRRRRRSRVGGHSPVVS